MQLSNKRRMHALRTARTLARTVLAWFALASLLALLAPLLHPQGFELVCSASGTVQLRSADLGTDSRTADHQVDCVLCIGGGSAAPPPAAQLTPQLQSLSHALRPVAAAHIAWRTAAPLPARGPPAVS